VSDFTDTVFLIVASLAGALIGLFTAGVIGVVIYDSHRPTETTEPVELPRAA
jgi:hypothetical protein